MSGTPTKEPAEVAEWLRTKGWAVRAIMASPEFSQETRDTLRVATEKLLTIARMDPDDFWEGGTEP